MKRQKYKDLSVVDPIPAGHTHFQPKYDGIWCCATVLGDHISYKSRNGMEKKQEENVYGMENGYYIGELMYGSQWAQDPSRLGKFFLFDHIHHEKDDRVYANRLKGLWALKSRQDGWINTPTYGIEGLQKFWDMYVETEKVEGIVYRDLNAKWSSTLYRAKYQLEVDMLVVGMTEGKGKHIGKMGALIGRRIDSNGLPYGPNMNVGGGYCDATRAKCVAENGNPIGRIMTVTAKKIFSSGKLRHPNFVRFHLEK